MAGKTAWKHPLKETEKAVKKPRKRHAKLRIKIEEFDQRELLDFRNCASKSRSSRWS